MAATGKTAPYGKLKYTSIDEYHEAFPAGVQALLDSIRQAIRQAAPQATETISYNIPTFKLKRNLVHYAAFTQHIGFYPAPSALAAFKKELGKYKNSKGAIQFPIDKPLPIPLIKKMVKFRLEEEMQGEKKTKPGKETCQ